ncbi:glycosyltransferase family 76 protein [Jaapia argillacea MUCL 33604]|uniref:Glycosyltransferase family 76 protein n=1 Tax=Jaapia argillacea MUCL 33604 TaxID=933084 RepID=A0A067Q2K9_9AGAM|nr:glycosyltransferase family 76 protein [Jaapia argillacea MUCL 33604]
MRLARGRWREESHASCTATQLPNLRFGSSRRFLFPRRQCKLRPTHLILLLTLLTRFLILALIYLSSYLPSFDSSPNILLPPPPLDASGAEKALWRVTNSLLRWDSFHFVHITKEGHVFEHE